MVCSNSKYCNLNWCDTNFLRTGGIKYYIYDTAGVDYYSFSECFICYYNTGSKVFKTFS